MFWPAASWESMPIEICTLRSVWKTLRGFSSNMQQHKAPCRAISASIGEKLKHELKTAIVAKAYIDPAAPHHPPDSRPLFGQVANVLVQCVLDCFLRCQGTTEGCRGQNWKIYKNISVVRTSHNSHISPELWLGARSGRIHWLPWCWGKWKPEKDRSTDRSKVPISQCATAPCSCQATGARNMHLVLMRVVTPPPSVIAWTDWMTMSSTVQARSSQADRLVAMFPKSFCKNATIDINWLETTTTRTSWTERRFQRS